MFKNWPAPRFFAVAFVIVTCSQAQEIHLKTRTISTASAPGAAIRSAVRQRPSARGFVHQIVEFNHPPGAADLDALLQAGAQVTSALPDDAVVVSVRGGLTTVPSDVIWIGNLEAQDKISPALATAFPNTETTFPVIVEFHSDITADEQNALSATLGVTFLRPATLVAQHVIVQATPAILAALSAQDEVAYIFPADPALLSADSETYPCAGMLTTAGGVAQYANVVHGWNLDSDNVAHLSYYFGSLTGKVPAATVKGEIIRALNAWSAHLNVTFEPSAASSVVRSIYIEFASGSHGDAYSFDGRGGVLAHTFYPVPINAETLAGDMHFDADEAWKVGADTDIYTVALHEVGHALGLSHSDNPGDVMYPYYHRGLPLSANDIGAAKQLYAPPAPAESAPVTAPVTVTTTPTTTVTSPTTPVSVTIDPAPASTQSAVINVTGIVTGGTGSYTVQWQTNHGSSGTATISTGSEMWTARNIPLIVGANAITITAFDTTDHLATGNVTVNLQAPSTSAASAPIAISIASPAAPVVNVNTPTITLSGTATGGAGITQVTWQTSNGVTGTATGISPWVASNIPVPSGTTTVIMHAYDSKGTTAWVAMVAVRH